jgi:penicillin-binding protein 2
LKYLENRKYIVQTIFFVVAAVFAIKLFFIQVLNTEYKHAAEANTIKRVVEYPFRGLIYDRNGKLLVQNMPVYDLMVVPKEIKGIDTLRFCKLFKMPLADFRLKIKAAKAYSYVKPSPFLQKLSPEEFAGLQDNMVEFPGFYVYVRTVRSYPHQSLAHALGYIGEVSPQQLENIKYSNYTAGDYLGKSGIEKQYEELLMGKKGVKYRLVNVRGLDKGSFKNGQYDTTAVAGVNLVSTIDLDLQKYAEKLLNGKRGSVVAIEPATGEILAYVSAPFYDPNLLTGKSLGNNISEMYKNPARPLFDRSIMAKYPPGSTFKTVQALIALQEGVIQANTGFPCNQNLVKCTHRHEYPGSVSIALKQSCNPYFYQVFRAAINQGKTNNIFEDTKKGLDEWRKHITSFGFASHLGIDLPHEQMGIIASSRLYDKIYGKKGWKYRTFYSLSIGQGEIGATPLQIANLSAIIANRGHYFRPHIVKSIGGKGGPLPGYQKKIHTSVSPKYFYPVMDGMQAVVEKGGTAPFASLSELGIVYCAKTGTSQNPHGEDHAVFMAFAPRQNPKIAIAVFIENVGFGGVKAAPVANLIMEKYLTGNIAKKRLVWEEWIMSEDFNKVKRH